MSAASPSFPRLKKKPARMMECRAITHLLLAEMMPDVPELIEASELEVKDITGEIKQDANFAITHRGKVIKDGFHPGGGAALYPTPSDRDGAADA